MVLTIKRNSNQKELRKLTDKIKNKKGFRASEFCGKVKVKTDAIITQRKLRDEWK